jgi:hypothetical protein
MAGKTQGKAKATPIRILKNPIKTGNLVFKFYFRLVNTYLAPILKSKEANA